MKPDFYTPPELSTYGVGRSVLALAQASILLLTPQWALTIPVIGSDPEARCRGVLRATAFCLTEESGGFAWGRVVVLSILALVIVGWRPRYTVIPHAWATLSLLGAISLPDGGEAAAVVVSVLVIPYGLADGRIWHWRTGSASESGWQSGMAAASSLALRAQVAIIYLQSGIAKIGVPDWANGSAIYYVTRELFFGATGPVGAAIHAVTAHPLGSAVITWGTIVVEVAIGVLILLRSRERVWALALAVSLHAGIIIVIGLWSFGLVMCGAVCMAAAFPPSALRPLRCGSSVVRARGLGAAAE